MQEIKKDEDWKTKMAKEWNDATAEEGGVAEERAPRRQDDETRSMGQTSFKSAKTGVSKGSLRSQVEKAIQEQGRPEWDGSVKSHKQTTEERVAQRLANEVLRDNAKLRRVHSN